MATSMSTQSWNDAASTAVSPKRSHAQRTASLAGSVSSFSATTASSPRSGTGETCGSSASSVIGCRKELTSAPRPTRSRRSKRRRSGDRSPERRTSRRAAPGIPAPSERDQRSCRAFRLADLGDVGTGLVEVDVEVGRLLRGRELVEVLERGPDRGGAAGALEPRRERLARLALRRELPDDAHDRFRRAAGGELGRLLA